MTITPTATRMASLAALALLVSACASPDQDSDAEPGADVTAENPAATEESHHDHENPAATEQAAQTPRIVVTFDGGIQVLDALTLEEEARFDLAGFNRLSSAGDGRHVAVSTTGGFQILDAGTWSQAHGDHSHYFTSEPALTDLTIAAEEPGHVVAHDGYTAFFDDGTGAVTVVDAGEWEHMVEEGHVDTVRTYTAAAPHHGVAVATEDGDLLVTVGTADARSGAMLLDDDGEIEARTDQCPGVHGEAAFETSTDEDLIMVGCETGAIIFHDDHAHVLTSPDAFGRIGNLFSVDGSDHVLGDYKTDPEGGINLAQVAIIDPEAETITPVDPFAGDEAEYTWQGLARGDDGEMLVLGTDGALRVLDPATGEVTRSIPVVGAWDVPEEWQTARPNVEVLDGMAYVTEPATGEIHIVDYVGGEVWKTVDVGVAVGEMVGVTG